ncbi:MAG: DUF397 domain-containing protein [Actinomycetota bacterium]|nr:DUF397 domain-containing protein [Actinomycetota bacterium]
MQSPDLSHAKWRKSSHSGNGSCVDVAPVPGAGSAAVESCDVIAVRDSKDRNGPALTFTTRQWRSFAAGIKAGELSLT